MSAAREVLLVGEGNFSFAAALCDSLDPGVRVTATCLQPEAEALSRENTQNNIQHLRDQGATVLFEVDCTHLKEHEVIRHHLYDCIVFNFPHCGRKSGVKKNRTLLAKFFASCAEVLKDNGEVHMALCNGQGGTPYDNPMREWHNSWQAVSMAAEAGLILSDIRPFDCDQFQGYRCTGYRSQDKGFHVEGALTHIFTRSLPYTMPEKLKMVTTIGKETVSYEAPEELSEFMNRDFLSQQSHHPVKTVLEQLLREIKSSWPVCTVSGSFPELVHCCPENLRSCGLTLTPSEVFWIKPIETHPLDQCKDGMQDCEPMDNQQISGGSFALRPSLLLHVQEIMQNEDFSPGTLHALSGLVFQRVPISPNRYPAYHQLLLVGVLPSKSKPLQCLRECVEGLLSPYNVSFKEDQLGEEHQIWINSKDVQNFGRMTSVPVPGSDFQRSLQLCVLLLNIDHLAALTFSIPDWRLLWTYDPRFLAHFETQDVGSFRPFSLYPASYSHDISFWMEPESFDELDFHAVVRVATAGAVKGVALVDRFRHPHMGHASLCYRLEYHSNDRALSHSQVLALQEQLRRLLPLRLQVTLR
ncbi:ferredoxin-fold anticodon-binding domain-containing protein 1 [Astyanax mexicanus]|uniref:phenylalanine--tRNA ligase n=1 Tax=Astyanax mexicanus TaxID=7994 RepID=A0A3B1KIT1_ASTMX|nr:ferredoxin-fold anticodon-binding domain-containing protein 1 [Astyanax mexicanus]XP_007245292.2 ferredoxin-fold anticodon-binding domain-containing protein 1 [Astyanax mexicanus]